ncbi:DUF3422 domain-containing protein [Limibaculum sp. M0105]|uniref:DUF3422 domain-containing protein n=1 Tax=Thermohalobaculum xanthum TaxID=2753746 RepID=A0A8J7M8P3_9RHOB|nr:DUF3422 domain-containing protein [Thermohalobaculum xanthum]MBK0400349.1 DUF3422 domain-containing protein [Thermohalobaculum xanthum]
MIKSVLDNHPRRFALTNELHARPFTPTDAPGRVLMVAFKETENAAERDPARDHAHLTALIDRHGGPHPAPDANHYFADFGRFRLKWERHTEFVSYTLFESGPSDTLFAGTLFQHLPGEWLAQAPGKVVAAVEIELIRARDFEAAAALIDGALGRQFARESMVVARVLDGAAVAIGDFRIHEGGFTRFALVVHDDVGDRRIGRAVQRLIEVENYRILSMLALPIARDAARRLNEIDRELTSLIRLVASSERTASEQAILDQLTALSAEIEAMSAATAFRFGAATAYEAIVHQRIANLREERMMGRQLFSEFMMRRYDPAMRTCHSTAGRLADMATRASRIGDLLRTRVDVAVEAQNQKLLASMNARADTQLRLQETVEGLSVVAISYYAVSLLGYALAPLAKPLGVDKTTLLALVALPVVIAVGWSMRRIRKRITRRGD